MLNRRLIVPVGPLLFALAALACSLTGQPAQPAATPNTSLVTAATESATQPGATPVEATPTGNASVPATPASSRAGPQAVRLVLVAQGTQARYRVREQLANISLPSDAIGQTPAVTGTLVINPDGTLAADQSKFVVDLTGLHSDSSQRDGWLRGHYLESDQYPTAEFDSVSVSGLAVPLPSAGAVTFTLAGNLTAHGVTQPATWAVSGQIVNGAELTGTASTSFKFEDYHIDLPRVPMVLSVVDKITLELDFHFVKAQ